MEHTDVNERIDLDNYLSEVVKNYPKNDDDYLLYIRGKNSTKELFIASCGEEHNLAYGLCNIAMQNNSIKNEIEAAYKVLKDKGFIE